MVWDRTHNKLVAYRQDLDLKAVAPDSYDPTEETTLDDFQIAPYDDIEGREIKQKLLQKVIDKRNQNHSENFIDFVAEKYRKLERK